MQIRATCKECNEDFSVSSVIGRDETVFNGETVYLTFVVCPKCGKKYYVQADNFKTIELLKISSELFIKKKQCERYGRKLPKKQAERARQTDLYLNGLRRNLINMLNGKSVVISGEHIDIDFNTINFNK